MVWLTSIKDFVSQKRVSPSTPPPRFLKYRSSKSFIIATICIAVFSDIFLYGVIVPVIPFALTSRTGTPESESQSYVSILLSVYGGALLLGSPIAGWFADRSSSRRMPLLLGLFALCGSTIMLMLARNVALMIVGRILQGFSGAVVWTVGIALLVDTVGEKEIGEVLGWISLSMSLGILVAPLVGGVLYEKSGYFAVYYVAFGLIALDIFLRLVLVEKKIARQWLGDDIVQGEASRVDAGFGGNTNPDLKASDDGIADEEGSGSAAAPKTSSNEIPREPQAAEPSLEDTSTPAPVTTTRISRYPPVLTLLKSRRLLAALWGCIIQGSLLTAIDGVVPLFVQETFGWNSIGAGLIFLAVIIPGFSAPAIGWLSDRHGPRWLCVFGFIFQIPFWVLLRFVTHNSLKQKVLLCALLSLIGFSLSMVS